MKRKNKFAVIAVMVLALFMIGVIPVFADSIPSNLEIFDETVVGAKIDLPDLIKITASSSLGAELGMTNMFEDWDQSGFVIVKYTWKGSLLDFTKK